CSTSFLSSETSTFIVVTSVVNPCPLSQIFTLAVRASMEARRGVNIVVMALSIIQGTSASMVPVIALGGYKATEELGAWEGLEVDVLEGSKAGVGKATSADKRSISTSGDVSTGASILKLASSRVYSAFMHRMSIDDMGVISTCLISSRGTPALRHNSVMST
ncbi:hypothetical protein H5410_021636, partial [Solanum commersonii]